MAAFRRTMSRRTLLVGTTATTAGTLLRPALAAGPAKPASAAPTTIWDAHAHLGGIQGSVPERIDQMLTVADRMGIDRLVVFMGAKWSHDPSPVELRQENDDVLQAVAHAPRRILGFVYLNPKHLQESLAEMDRCVRHGPMVGVKLWVAMRCNQPEIDPIVRRAVELNVPLLQHTYFRLGGNLPGESSPSDLAELALRHPTASFICAHTGADWEQGTRAIRASPNVWAETGGCDPVSGQVEMAVRELGASRVIYGSDAAGRSFASQLAKIESAELSDADKQMILGGNLRRLLAGVLSAKRNGL